MKINLEKDKSSTFVSGILTHAKKNNDFNQRGKLWDFEKVLDKKLLVVTLRKLKSSKDLSLFLDDFNSQYKHPNKK